MAPDPRVVKAFDAMKVLGISSEEVKPVLKELLKLYDKNWELIEEDNYRTLVDAYFDFKEDKGIRCKNKSPSSCRAGQKVHLVDEDGEAPISANYNGLSESSNGDGCVKSLSTPNQNMRKKDVSSSHNNNTTTLRGDIPVASSPNGEIKLSLSCNSALLQPNFSSPNLNAVMKMMNEKCVISNKTTGSQLSMEKLLKILCTSFLKIMGHKKGSNSNDASSLHLICSDIARGSEKIKIPLINEFGSEKLPSNFTYTSHSMIYQSAIINMSVTRISDESYCFDCSGNCLSLSLPCACARETGGEYAYTPMGLLKEEFLTACLSMKTEPKDYHFVYCQECPIEKSKNEYLPDQCKGHMVRKFIKECWSKCKCHVGDCGNRVVQGGIRCQLQVFMTRQGKGWGLRTLEDLPKGSFVCEYTGEILTNTELYQRIMEKSGKDRHTYPVTLDADWGSEGVLKDEEALCLDATYRGNVGRFINHRCFDANLIDIPVEIETPDHHYYHLAFFTNRNVKAYEELTWDYGIDFNDHDHPIKAFQCCCGSAFCSNKKGKGKRKIDQVHVTRDN